MYSEHFKIKKSKDNNEEIEITVVTGNNLVHPDFTAYSSAPEHIEHCKQNYKDANRVLSELIEEGILAYYKSEGNEHIFKHTRILGSEDSTFERVSINDIKNGNIRTLEEMLYSVCRVHNKPTPSAISPKTLFTTMYDRVMYPSAAQQIENVAYAVTATAFFAGVVAVLSVAETTLKFATKKPRPN